MTGPKFADVWIFCPACGEEAWLPLEVDDWGMVLSYPDCDYCGTAMEWDPSQDVDEMPDDLDLDAGVQS